MLLPALIALLATAPVGGCLRGDAEETIAASRVASGVQPVQHAKGTSSSPSLAQAERLAAVAPELARRLAPTKHGLASRNDAVRGPASTPGQLHATLAQHANNEMTLSQGAGMAYGTRWQLEGARASSVELHDGRAVYQDALASTDVLWTAEENRAELFLLLRDNAAPTSFRWRIALGSGLVKGVAENTGAVAFVDAAGHKRLRVGAAFAVDAAGTRREASIAWNDGALRLRVDTSGLVFPVLVDPPVETVQWEQALPSSFPEARFDHSLAYDSAHSRTLLFGGGTLTAAQRLSDTWEWDGTSWTERTPSASPPARRGHAMAFDSARGKTVLFGGSATSGVLSDTWEWNGTAWTERFPATTPSARAAHAMAFDSARGATVLFGGAESTGAGLSDTWEWDGTTWTNTLPATIPFENSGLYSHSVAYDSTRGRTVLYGGGDFSLEGLTAATWEYWSYGGGCTANTECDTGLCVDGVCCETACDGQCQACNEPNQAGTCVTVAGTPRSGRPACAGTGDCQGTCDGTTATSCSMPDTSKTCAAGSCASGTATAASTCDGAGTCQAGMETNCGAYTCGTDTCKTTCTVVGDCATGYGCVGGACVVEQDGGAEAGEEAGEDAADDAAPDATAEASVEAGPDATAEASVDAGAENDTLEAGDVPAAATPASDSGCGCRLAGTTPLSGRVPAFALLALAGAVIVRRRNRSL